MMNDAFEMCGDADTEDQAEEVYNQILGEIGMNVNSEIAAGSGQIAQPAAAQPNAADGDLQARLDALRGM